MWAGATRAISTVLVLAALMAATGCAGSPAPMPPATAGAEPPPSSGSAPPPPPPPPADVPPATPTAAPALPAFPWPPPRYSAFATIVREWVAGGPQPTLGSAAQRLEAAFDTAGYGERSYYSIPGGFALVSRIEQIRPDASSVDAPARWAVEAATVRAGFIDHIRALFNAPPGFYRVIVFAVTDQDFAAAGRAPTSAEARAWITSGSLRLPPDVGSRPYSAQHYTSALIYEFERRADRSEAEVRTPSNSPGRVHLEKTGIWQALARP